MLAGFLARRSRRIVSPTSPTYEAASRAFYHGLAALEVGLLDDARTQFTSATEIVPDEPASWANLGLTHLRLGELDPAAQAIERAEALAPTSSEVAFLHGQLETARGRPDQAVARFRLAVERDPRGLRVRYALAQEIEAAAGPTADADAQALLDELLTLAPDNVAALLVRARFAATRADGVGLQNAVARLEPRLAGWPEAAVEQSRGLQAATARSDFSEAARTVAILRNVLLRVPSFREDLIAMRTPAELIAEPFDRFLTLAPSTSRPSPADEALTFTREPLGAERTAPWSSAMAFSSDGTEAAAIFAADARELRRVSAPGVGLPFPGGGAAAAPSANSVLPIDWNRDFRNDLVLAGRGGIRLLVQETDGSFRDATASAAGNDDAVSADSFGVWAADVEMDGDLDVIVGVNGAAPIVLRNNGDGTWRRLQPFAGVVGLRGFAWADLDRDGDPDAALLDAAGNLHFFENRQGGQFDPMRAPEGLGNVVSLAIGDVNGDTTIDVTALDARGVVRRVSWASDAWGQSQTLAESRDWPTSAAPGDYRLFLDDLDNNGSADLTVSGGSRTRIWLSGEAGQFSPLGSPIEADVFSIVDLNADGYPDLAGLSNGQPARWIARGTKGYHWQVLRPRAQAMAGDQRINSFGVGGEIEIRSGLLTQKQVIAGPSVHFGLGTRTGVDVARIVWPNGVVQADFDSSADAVIVAEQRLKGSCPWVFTYDGTGMNFVTDFLWRSPLGLRINAQDTAGVSQTEDWVKIRGDQLAPRDGGYDVRITAELWETHYVDHVSLMAVDHPANLDVFVDERFSKDAPALQVQTMTKPRQVTHASDEAGRDVTDLVARRDGRYLASFERGDFQGVAQDHFVEVDLGREMPRQNPGWFIANGWIYPTDSSINVAIGQSSTAPPRGLSLEAQDESGRWIVVSPDLGFPAGKNKTIVIDLATVVRAGISGVRRLRLRTNLEIYWDWLAVADAAPNAPLETRRLAAARAELRYRGFSKTDFGQREIPERPLYNELANVVPRWRDLVGYYTRFGDVRDLLGFVDDRYVIMNAGDELQMTFPELPAPPAGWTRDFVLIGDGWNKDGDYNTSLSKTVLPLPSHGHPDYAAPASPELEADPIFRRHPQDWQTYHTRFVTADPFVTGLR